MNKNGKMILRNGSLRLGLKVSIKVRCGCKGSEVRLGVSEGAGRGMTLRK